MKPTGKPTLEDLQHELESLQLTLDHVGAFVFTVDAQGRYTYANQMACDLLGCKLADIVGRHPSDFFESAASDPMDLSFRRVLEHGERVEVEEVVAHKGSTDPRAYWTVRMPLFSKKGAVVGACIVSKDISERRKLEKEHEAQRHMFEAIVNNSEAYI